MPISADGLDLDDPALEARLELMRGAAGAWREDRAFQLQALGRLGVRPDHRLLEIGCGPLQAGAALIRYLDPGCYTGVDASPQRLQAARDLVDQFGLSDQSPRLVNSDDFGIECLAPQSFDRIWCYQVAIHFSLPIFERFMTAISVLLEPDGIAWFSARVAPDGGDFGVVGSWLEFPVTEAGEDFYQGSADRVGLQCTALGTLGEWGLPASRPGAKNFLFELRRRD